MDIRPKSITHQHLLSVIHTERRTSGVQSSGRLRLLDMGCGDGELLLYLHAALSRLQPDQRLELYGCDVQDSRVQAAGFLRRTVTRLQERCPQEPWADRILAISSGDAWPFADGYFDIIVSNQVLEHVLNPDHFFAQMRRTLEPDGFGVHLFPLVHYLLEGHVQLPLAHRVQDHDLLRWYITWCSRLGLGKYAAHRKRGAVDLNVFAERHADYLHYFTHYLSQKELLRVGKRHQLRMTLRYTRELYGSKLRASLHLPPRYAYSTRRLPLVDALAVRILRYVSGVTLLATRRQSY